MPNSSITTPSPPSLSSSSTSPVSQSPMLGSSALNKTNCNSFYRALQDEKNKQKRIISLIRFYCLKIKNKNERWLTLAKSSEWKITYTNDHDHDDELIN